MLNKFALLDLIDIVAAISSNILMIVNNQQNLHHHKILKHTLMFLSSSGLLLSRHFAYPYRLAKNLDNETSKTAQSAFTSRRRSDVSELECL